MFQPLVYSAIPAGTKRKRFQSVHKERAAIPYVYHNVSVTTITKTMKTNFSCNNSFVKCWVWLAHPPRQVRSTTMVWYAVCRHPCSSPSRESVPVFSQISITFPVTSAKIAVSIGVIQNLVLIAFWES